MVQLIISDPFVFLKKLLTNHVITLIVEVLWEMTEEWDCLMWFDPSLLSTNNYHWLLFTPSEFYWPPVIWGNDNIPFDDVICLFSNAIWNCPFLGLYFGIRGWAKYFSGCTFQSVLAAKKDFHALSTSYKTFRAVDNGNCWKFGELYSSCWNLHVCNHFFWLK